MTRPGLGVFGGSFDPVHLGHLHAARAARAARGLERVLFLPARQSPHKLGRDLAPGARRAELLDLALADEPDFVVDTRELRRAGPSYTIDTLRELRAEHAGRELFLILGSDNLPGLPDWRSVDELLALVTPLVVHREEDPDVLLEALADRLPEERIEALAAGFLRVPPFACSSTELRERLDLGASTEGLLPPAVRERIDALGLYAPRSEDA